MSWARSALLCSAGSSRARMASKDTLEQGRRQIEVRCPRSSRASASGTEPCDAARVRQEVWFGSGMTVGY